MLWLPACFVNGHYVPVGVDSFYHARRILDTVADPGAFYEFDPRIHAPEGSWITWPWAYDLLVAWIVRALQRLSGTPDPMTILVYIPPTWTFVNAALLVGVGATLGLGLRWLALLGAAFALSPLTQMLHAVGVIDHHYVEYTFVLATALAGLRWLQVPDDWRRAALLGAVLGAAPAFHNGLFSLQIPVDATLLLLWLRGQMPPARSVAAFAVGLAALTLAAVLPSEPFRDGQFSMTTLSWFHLYVAVATCGGALALATFPRSRRNLAALALLAGIALIPGATEMVTGFRFLAARLVKLDNIAEAFNLYRSVTSLGLGIVNANYSAWWVLAPLVMAASAASIWRKDLAPHWQYGAVFALFGTVLMCFQARLHYFGTPALFIAPLLALRAIAVRPEGRAKLLAALGLTTLAAGYQPAWDQLRTPVPPAWQFDGMYDIYDRLVYPRLRAACARKPGVVLAANDDGHYIRFNTGCSVIANNFILTRQHEEKLLEAQHALSLGARELLDQYPYVDYVFLHQPSPDAGLAADLLYGDRPIPPEFRLIAAVVLTTDKGPGVLAKVFQIDRGGHPPDRGEKG